jgi:hypothetical protein
MLSAQKRDEAPPRIVSRGPQSGGRDASKLVLSRIRDLQPCFLALLHHEVRQLIADQLYPDIVIVKGTERLLDRLYSIDLALANFPDLGSEQLKCVAEPLSRDSQVMQSLG